MLTRILENYLVVNNKRVAIVRTLAMKPELFYLMKITASLDPWNGFVGIERYLFKKKLSEKISAAENIQLIGITYFYQQLDAIQQVESYLRECETKLKRKRELGRIIQSLKKLQSEITAVKEKLELLELIDS